MRVQCVGFALSRLERRGRVISTRFLAAPSKGQLCDSGLIEFAFAHLGELGVFIKRGMGEWCLDAVHYGQS